MTHTAKLNQDSQGQQVYQRLASWWQGHARDLPWRGGRADPWGILVSEVMSQQTQMSRVAPYWTTWMDLWPTAQALAQASPAEVIVAWGRLGYPRRALRLQECARVVTDQYQGQLPADYDSLVALPGVGDYTASAVLSFAFGQRVSVIDTNIRRVLTRVFTGSESHGGSAKPADRALALKVLPKDPEQSVLWNQATMELGALVCSAQAPQCEACPLQDSCKFLLSGKPGLGRRRTRPRQHFQGTDRQVRGIVLANLRSLPSRSCLGKEQVEQLWPDSGQLSACLASLDEDGLIEIMEGGAIRLPR